MRLQLLDCRKLNYVCISCLVDDFYMPDGKLNYLVVRNFHQKKIFPTWPNAFHWRKCLSTKFFLALIIA